jgi:hypothetical protein
LNVQIDQLRQRLDVITAEKNTFQSEAKEPMCC